MQLALQIGHQRADGGGVAADAERRDERVDRRLRAFIDVVAERLAPTAYARIGVDAHEQRVERRPHLAAESGRRPALAIRNPQQHRLDGGDLHGVLSLECRVFSTKAGDARECASGAICRGCRNAVVAPFLPLECPAISRRYPGSASPGAAYNRHERSAPFRRIYRMSPSCRLLRTALVAVPLLSLATACVVAPPPHRVAVEVVAPKPPPPVRYEAPPPPPPDRAELVVWDPGHWRWDGHDWAWQPGHYIERPRREAHWVPGRWAARPDGTWAWVEGRWR
jgi:hypothetical protein